MSRVNTRNNTLNLLELKIVFMPQSANVLLNCVDPTGLLGEKRKYLNVKLNRAERKMIKISELSGLPADETVTVHNSRTIDNGGYCCVALSVYANPVYS